MKLKTRLLLSMALASFNLFGATYYWNGGTITSLSSWPNAKGGSTFASNFTTSGDIWDLNLASSANVDISGWSTNGKLTNSAASTIIATLTTTSGDFTSSYVGAVWVVPTTNLVVSGINVIYSAAGATIPGLTYANLRFSNSTGTSTAAAAITVSGTLTTTSGGTLAMEANTLTFSGTGTTLTNGGTITSRVATPFADSRTTKTFGGTVTYLSLVGGQAIASGTYTTLNINCTAFTNTAAGEISVSGTLTTASGGTLVMGSNTLTFSASGTTLSNSGTISTAATTAFTDSRTTKTFGGTITYSALAGGQTIATGNYATLTLSNTSGTNTANGAIAVTNALIIPSSTTLNMSTYALTCSGTIANYGTLKTSATNNPPFTTTTTSMGGTVEFASANGGQFIPDKTYALLTLSNTSGTNTARGAIISSGALTIGASTILDMSSYVLTCSSTLTNNGTIKISSITNPPFTTTSTSIGGTVQFTRGIGGQFIPGKTYAILTLSNTSGTNTALGVITSTGDLTIPASTELDMATYGLTCSSTLTNNGNLRTSTTTNPAFTTTTTSIGGTVRFAASSGGQFIPGKTYATLTLSNTSGTNTAIGAITSTGDLTIPTTSTTLDMSTYVLTCSGTLSNNGILKTSSTANPPFTTTTTSIAGTVQFTASSGGQYIPAKTYAIITLSNTSGTNTAIGAFTSSGELTIPASTTLDMSTFRLTMSSTLRNFGTLKTSSTANPPFSTGTTSIGGTVEFAAASGGQFIPGKTYSTLMLSNTSGTNTALGSIISLLALTIPASTTFDMSTFDFTCSGSLTNNGTLKLSSTSNPPYSTSNSTLAGTVEFAASGGGQFIPVKTYTNLSLSNTGGTSMSVLGDITVSGNLTIASGSTLVMGANTLILSAAGTTLTNNGTISTTSTVPFTDSRTSLIFGGTINYNRSNGLRNIAIGNYTNLTLSNSSGIYTALGAITVSGTLTTTLGGTLAMGTNTLTLSGTATTLTNGGTITTSATTAFTDTRTTKTFGGTVNYGLATGGQTIASGSYSTLTLSNTSGTNTANGAIDFANDLIIPTSTILDMSIYVLTSGVSAVITNNGTLKTSATNNPPFSSRNSTLVGKVEFAAPGGGQFIPVKTYTNLSLSHTSGTSTALGAITVNGTLTTTSGGYLDMATNTLSLGNANTFNSNGTILSSAINPINDQRLTNGGVYSGTIVLNRTAGGQTIASGGYVNLTLSNTSGSQTAGGTITVSGTLTTTAGGTLAMGGQALILNLGSTLTNGGTISTTKTSGWVTDNRTTKTFGGTVNYGLATGAQTIASGDYSTLTLSNTSGTNTANGAITVANAFTIPASTTLDMSTFGITCSSTLTNSGTLKTSSTANPPFSTTSTSVGGTVQLAVSTGGQSIPSFTYNNLTLSNSSGNQTLNGDIKIQGTLTITSGGKLKLNGYSIPAVNAFSGTGQIIGGSASRMNITGSSAGTFYMDQTTPLTTNRLKYLGLAVSATATLGNTVAIYGDSSYSGNVDLKTSSVLTSNTIGTNAALLQLKYNVASEYHAVLGMNGGSLLGEAMVEDYFYSGSRTYRQVGHALDSAMSLNQITDDFDLFGLISNGSSGRGSGKNKDGLYAATSTAKNSVFTYKEDVASGSKWVPFTTSTSNSTIATGTGIMFVMRPTGSGESGNYNAQIMDYEGAINQRRRAVSVLKNTGTGTYGYNLLANPYAAYLDFSKFIDTNSAMLADVGFYKYNKSTKNYTTHSKSGSLWFKSSIAFTVNSANVDPGDAFWIRVNSAGTVYMNPKMTAYSKATDVSRENKLEIDTTAYSMLGIKMKSQADTTLGDEVSILSASWGGDMSYKQGDMANMNGTCIDLSVVSSDKEYLAFKTLSITQSWLIQLNVQACAIGSYSFDFAIDANKPGYEAEYELLDKYLNKSMKIVSGNKLTFEVNADAASMGGDRFYINAIPSKVLNDNDLNTDRVVTIFPNPISSADVLKIHVAQGKGLQIELVNAMGQQLYRAEHVAGGRILEVDLMSLRVAPGIYYLKATRDNESETQRVIIN